MALPQGLLNSAKYSLRAPPRHKAALPRAPPTRATPPDTAPPSIPRPSKGSSAVRAAGAGIDAQLDAEERAEALAMRELQVYALNPRMTKP